MSYPPEFYTELHSHLQALHRRSIVRNEYPPTIPTHSRNAIYSHISIYGSTGQGKTIALCHLLLECYKLHAPQFGVNGMKIFWIDMLKGELCASGIPMTPDHPLYNIAMELGLHPESYPVEVLRPLVFIRGKPDLLYEQPHVVKPFTICLADLSLQEWVALLPGGLSPGQMNLLDKALKELHNNIDEVTIQDLYVQIQSILERGDVGWGTHIVGLENAPTIPMSKRVFSGREGSGLLQKIQVLADTSLLMPRYFRGKKVETNIDIKKILEDKKTITCLYVPRYQDLPHLNYGIINYFLNHILWLKNPNNPDRVSTPVVLAFPELRDYCPKHVPENARYYMEPVKNMLLTLVSQGAGIGIKLITDTQFWKAIPEEYRANVTTSLIFDLGEESADAIRELVKNRFVSNFKEITDDYHLSALREPGTFIYLGYGRTRAEIRKGCMVAFWYPRARGKGEETETNFYDLYKRFYPDRFKNIFPLYVKLLEINREAQERASKRMMEILEKSEEKKQKKKRRERDEALDSLIKALDDLTDREGTILPWGSTVEKLQYYQPEGYDSPILNYSRNHIVNLLKKASAIGYIYIDKTKGRTKWMILANKDKIKESIKELEEETKA